MQGQFQYPYIEVVDHPDGKVRPGETVELRAYYYAYAPEQNWWDQEWTVSVVAYPSGDPSYPILGQNDTTHLTEGPIEADVEFEVGKMPSQAITYLVVLWGNLGAWKTFPFDAGGWVQLDARYFTVQPDLTPEYEGTISRKELEYDSEQETIPAVDVPFANAGLVHIWGRNDTDENQKMGIEWWVRNPSGTLVEHYYRWETLWTSPGNAQHFIGDRFDFTKAGNWNIEVHLLMNQTSPVVVDTYNSRLCNVLTEEEVYKGTISRKELQYDSTFLAIPANDIPYGESVEVNIYGRNDTQENQKMGIRWWVRDPDGIVQQTYTDWELTWTGPGNAQHFVGPNFTVDKGGNWNIKVELLMNQPNPVVVDTYDSRLCTVLPEEEPYEGTITKKEIEYDGSTALIPAVGIPLHDKGIVRIYGRNDTSSNQKMGIAWTVKDPDGLVWQNYTNWELTWTGPGNVQTFKGPSKEFTKAGQHTIDVVLLMNPDNPVEVDSYTGDMCDVGAGPEPEYDALEITAYPSKVTQDQPLEVTCSFKFRGPSITKVLYAALWKWQVWDPHDEVAHGEVSLQIPGSADWVQHTKKVVIYAACDLGTYGLYCKIDGITPDIISPYYTDVVVVEGAGPEEDLFKDLAVTFEKV